MHPNIASSPLPHQVPISLHLPHILLRSSRSPQICDGTPRMSSHSALPSRSQNRPPLAAHRGIRAILLTPICKSSAVEYPSDLREPIQIPRHVYRHTNSLPRIPDIKTSPLTELTEPYPLSIKMYPPLYRCSGTQFFAPTSGFEFGNGGREDVLTDFLEPFHFCKVKKYPRQRFIMRDNILLLCVSDDRRKFEVYPL